METYITLCKIDSQGEFAVCLRKPNRGSRSTYRGRMGREMGGGSKERGYTYTNGWFTLRSDRKQHNSVKQFSFNKKINKKKKKTGMRKERPPIFLFMKPLFWKIKEQLLQMRWQYFTTFRQLFPKIFYQWRSEIGKETYGFPF